MNAIDANFESLERLFGSVAPLPGEAPWSWVFRMAFRYAWSPSTMAKFLGWPGGFSELDFSLNSPDPTRLEWVTSRDMREIGVSFQMGRGLLGLTTYRCLTVSDGAPILRYCPFCLREDEVPYHRLEWRLASSILCRRHGIALRKTCPHCGSGIITNVRQRLVLPASERHRFLNTCRACGKLLSDVDDEEVSHALKVRLLPFQGLLWDVIRRGVYSHPTYGVISAKKFLEVYLVKLAACNNVYYTGLNWRLVAGELMEEFAAHGLVVPKKRGRIWNSTEAEAQFIHRTPGNTTCLPQ